MMSEFILEPNELIACEVLEGRLVVRFTSSRQRNPLSSEVLGMLETIVEYCETVGTFSEVIFTGTNNVFASGANLYEIKSLNSERARAFSIRGQFLMNRISRLSAKTTAAINGYCFGGALDLALACDQRIALESATFCHPGAGLGIITGWGGTQRLQRLIGTARACEIFFIAEPISALTALSIGLIDRINNDIVLAPETVRS